MKANFRTDKFLMSDAWYDYFQKHATLERCENGDEKVVDVDINDDFIRFISDTYINILREFISSYHRRPILELTISGHFGELSQKPKEEKLKFYKELYMGKAGFPDYRYEEGKEEEQSKEETILCTAIIDKDQHAYFETNYEFELPEIRISGDYKIQIMSAEQTARYKSSAEEMVYALRFDPKVELVDLELQDRYKAIYLCFLNHPKGFLFRHIGMEPYRKEITDAYIDMSHRNKDTLDNLFENTTAQSEAKSRINKAIQEAARDYSRFYTIEEDDDKKRSYVRLCSLYPELIHK